MGKQVELDKPFVIKDSGKREEFASGMVRDITEGKIDYHRVADGPMFERWAVHLTKGKQKYADEADGTPNWMKASGFAEYLRFRESAFRHFAKWWFHEVEEDEAAATFFNINGAEYTKTKGGVWAKQRK